jgi:hypothetical protein
MLQGISQNGRVRFSCVPEPARTISKDLETRKRLVRERIGRIVQIHCQFLEGDVFLPNPAKHTDHIDVVSVVHPEESGWKALTREHSVSFLDHEITQTDSGHRDSIIVVSEKPLNRNVGIFLAPADCAVVGLAHRDPNVDFAALIHSGWKGTAKDIVGQTIDAVKTIF